MFSAKNIYKNFLCLKKRIFGKPIIRKSKSESRATPQLYHGDVKRKAEENEAALCDMDDPELYGEEVYRIGFRETVDKNLQFDYKVLIMTVGCEWQLPPKLKSEVENPECQEYVFIPAAGSQAMSMGLLEYSSCR